MANPDSESLPSELALGKMTTYQAGLIQSRVHRILRRETTAALKKHDLSMMQWFVIGTIYDYGSDGIRLTDLAVKVDTTLAFLTTMINMLEARDILQRLDHGLDNRAKLVSVTGSFAKRIPKIESDLRHDLRETLYPRLSPAELHAYIATLHKLSGIKETDE